MCVIMNKSIRLLLSDAVVGDRESIAATSTDSHLSTQINEPGQHHDIEDLT